MAADVRAGELDAISFAVDADQSEVAGTAADVADKNRLPVEELFVGARKMSRRSRRRKRQRALRAK